MLVLSRKINEFIQIGTDVEVTVIDVRGDVVRLGIRNWLFWPIFSKLSTLIFLVY